MMRQSFQAPQRYFSALCPRYRHGTVQATASLEGANFHLLLFHLPVFNYSDRPH